MLENKVRADSINYQHTKSGFANHFFLFSVISIFTFLLQNFLPESELKYGFFIPDVVNMSQTLDYVSDGSVDSMSSGFWSIYILYKIAWIFHPSISIVINLILIYFSFKLIKEIFINNGASSLAYWGLILNPYIYLAVIGPNKEIPLIFGTLYILKVLLFKPQYGLLKVCILLIFMFFIRDGFAIILALSLIIFYTPWGSVKNKFLLGVGILVLVAISIDWFFENLTVFERNVLLSQTISQDQNSSAFVGDFLTGNYGILASIVKLFLRFIYNSFTLSFFPVVYTINGGIYPLGISYWLFGVINAVMILSLVYIIFKSFRSTYLLPQMFLKTGYWSFFLFLAISVSLFVQPRYFMTVLPVVFPIFSIMSVKSKATLSMVVVILTMSLITVYLVLGRPPGKVDLNNTDSINASFLIN